MMEYSIVKELRLMEIFKEGTATVTRQYNLMQMGIKLKKQESIDTKAVWRRSNYTKVFAGPTTSYELKGSQCLEEEMVTYNSIAALMDNNVYACDNLELASKHSFLEIATNNAGRAVEMLDRQNAGQRNGQSLFLDEQNLQECA